MANYRNKKLLEIVRKCPCQNCGTQDGTVVAAHSNWREHGNKGMGIKADDSAVAALCHRCHYEIDQGLRLSRSERRDVWLNAHARTLRWLIENDYLSCS